MKNYEIISNSKTSETRTLMACLLWLIQMRFLSRKGILKKTNI